MYEQFLDKFDTPENSKLAKIASLKFMFKKPHPSQYLMDSNNVDLKFKLHVDCLEFKSSHILLINIINLKLCLINFVHFV